jgi:uncharacterized protein (TIGR02231 family)
VQRWLWLLALVPFAAYADEALQEEAKRRMNLSFDAAEVEGMLEQPAPAAPARLSVAPIPRAALPLEPNSAVAQVVVFSDRALVTRTRSIELKPGVHSLSFDGLPPAIQEGSLHATATGATLLGVEVVSGKGEVDELRKKAIKEELRKHLETLGAVQDRIESLLAQRAALRRSAQAQGQNGPLPVRDLEALLAFVATQETKIAADLRVQEDKARDLDEVVRPLLVKLRDPVATGKTVRVDVQVDKPGTTRIDLRYGVNGAGWTPAYDVRFDPARGQVDLAFFGVVRQDTGDIWKDAPVTLSTARPEQGGSLPMMPPWNLGYGAIDVGLLAGRGTVGGERASSAPSDLLAEKLDADVEGTGAVLFRLPGPRTVVGDGSAQRLPLGVQTYRVRTTILAAPRVADNTVREGELTLGGRVPLLPGPAATYVGGDFVGAGSLPASQPGASLRLALGAADGVGVERRIVRNRRDLSGRRARYDFGFAVDVTNHGKTPIRVQLRDQVPVSTDADVQVRLDEGTPAPDPAGLVTWTVELQPGETKTVTFGFQVSAPADRSIPELDALL